jgi:uncharacterized membrane protein
VVQYSRRQVVTDVLALVAVVTPAVAVYYLVPPAIQSGFAFEVRSPELLDAVASTYLHVAGPDAVHLWTNVLSYLLVAVPAWWLHLVTGRRRQFWAVVAAFILVAPVVIAAGSHLWFTAVADTADLTTRGFSGVVSALAGYLLMSVLYLVADIREEETMQALTGTVASVVVATLLVVNVERLVPLLEALRRSVPSSAIAATGLGAVYTTRRTGVLAPGSVLVWTRRNTEEAAAVALGLVGFVVVFLAAFPSTAVQSGLLVNVFGHGVGVLLGVLAGAAVNEFNLERRRGPASS